MARASQVDLNKANADELIKIAGINQERARLIVDYREEHGPFRSWEELKNVPGIGATLAERAQKSATLGKDDGDGEESAEAAGAEEEELEEEDDEDAEAAAGEEAEDEDEEEADEDEEEPTIEEEFEALVAVGQLDLEAAAAYEIAAQAVEDPKLSEMLLAFGGDHRRHVDDMKELMKARDVEAEIMAPDPQRSVFMALASAVGSLDPSAALETMIANEQLTNATYDTALWLVTDEEALKLVERNRQDEKRHLEALVAYASDDEER